MAEEKTAEEIWAGVLTCLSNELEHSKFESWIRPITPVSVENKTFVIATKDTLSRDWVRERFSSLICKALKDTTRRSYNLNIVLKKDLSEDFLQRKNQLEKKFAQKVVEPKSGMKLTTREGAIPQVKPVFNEFQIDALKSTSYNLNLKYTFDNFVVGENNKFAHAAAMAVAKEPAKLHNPLFIYGGTGLGKTHLMHAIGHYILVNHPRLKIKYTNTEVFMNDLISCIQSGSNSTFKMSEFRQKYRNVDVLLLDDVQFLESKKTTQTEIFHTFENLYNSGKQIVLTSDRPPKEIPTLTDRLRSRFEWGLLADISAPDFETRVSILKKKTEIEKLNVTDDVLKLIASAYSHNVRELEGALNRVIAYCSINSLPVVPEVVKNIVEVSAPKNLSVEDIVDIVAEYFKIDADEIMSPSKSKDVSKARQIAIYLIRETMGYSFPKIGEALGGRKHTTVLYSYEKVKEEKLHNIALSKTIDEIAGILSKI